MLFVIFCHRLSERPPSAVQYCGIRRQQTPGSRQTWADQGRNISEAPVMSGKSGGNELAWQSSQWLDSQSTLLAALHDISAFKPPVRPASRGCSCLVSPLFTLHSRPGQARLATWIFPRKLRGSSHASDWLAGDWRAIMMQSGLHCGRGKGALAGPDKAFII